ncbi:MAG: hypothetical protein DHS80DRAFT_21669 [Piptocephalis tieghemiana]|nr:MAG: hypothetical protein DHS80DRAFT_21669 [Piptocephalis tieghemiana]
MPPPTACPLCAKPLRSFHLDLKAKVQLCPDPNCIYPMLEPNLSSFLSLPPTSSFPSKKRKKHPRSSSSSSLLPSRASPYPKARICCSPPPSSSSLPYNDIGLSRTPTALLAPPSTSSARDHRTSPPPHSHPFPTPLPSPSSLLDHPSCPSSLPISSPQDQSFPTSEDLHQLLFADIDLSL